jgi:hypothetical protein
MRKGKRPKISRYVRIAQLALWLAEQVIPRYSHPNSPKTYTQPQLVACVILKVYLGLSYRDTEEWLLASDQVCRALGLEEVPDHSTISRVIKRVKMATLQELNHQLLRHLAVEEDVMAVDGTGFSLTQASDYYLTRRGNRRLTYIRGIYLVGVNRQFILGWRSAYGPGNEMAFLNGMRRRARPYAPLVKGQRSFMLLADRGFDGKAARPYDIIPPRRPVVRLDRRQRATMVDMATLDGIWGHRWKSETVHSVIKRLSGSAVLSRRRAHQQREIGFKALAYNIHR